MARNANLISAKRAKNDEFYTQLPDIENELKHYRKSFKDKVIYLNCDDSRSSNFWRYFVDNFSELGIKEVVSLFYSKTETPFVSYYNGSTVRQRYIKGDGDFRSDESIKILKEADIIVTNPPFSLFREYVAQLMEYDKKFLIIGNKNAAIYKDIFPLFQYRKVRFGVSRLHKFMQPDGTLKNMAGLTRWFTNLPVAKRDEDIILYKKYNPTDYPEYDNFKAINVDKVKDIPMDYFGAMGVPITFFDSFNPKQFEITALRKGDDGKDLSINGKKPFTRVLIKRVK